ncbi:MAG: hypothetical protein GY822_31805 [Deltaproteobacteria bacterium]|nr:hypothetical protein [Deltaproteobacteria bacterium]
MKYYILVGIHKENKKDDQYFDLIFSDYDKECVNYEKESESHNYKKMKVIIMSSASQKIIELKLAQLNCQITKEEFKILSTENELEQLEKKLVAKKATLSKLGKIEIVTKNELFQKQAPCFNFELTADELVNEALKRGFITKINRDLYKINQNY